MEMIDRVFLKNRKTNYFDAKRFAAGNKKCEVILDYLKQKKFINI